MGYPPDMEGVSMGACNFSWRTTGYARRPHLPIVKETNASWFFEKPNGQRIKVSKTDRIRVWGADGEYWEKI